MSYLDNPWPLIRAAGDRAKSPRRKAAKKQPPTMPSAIIAFESESLDFIVAADSEAADDKPKLKRFKMSAYGGGTMEIEYYPSPVAIDLAGLKVKTDFPVLLDHDRKQIIGHADTAENNGKSLKVEGVISGVGAAAQEVVASAANGFPWRASVGVQPDVVEFVDKGQSTNVNSRTLKGPLYVARKSRLVETSFVAIPADQSASVSIAASHPTGETDMEFSEWIAAQGITEEGLRDDVLQYLRGQYDAELKAAAAASGKDIKAAAADVKPLEFDLPAIEYAYVKHQTDIEAKALEYVDKIPVAEHAVLCATARKAAVEAKAAALKERWTATRLETEYLVAGKLFDADLQVASRPKGPAIHASSRDFSASAIEAAFCRTVGVRNVDTQYKPEVMEAADQFRNLGISRLLLLCAQQNGYAGRPWVDSGNLREVMRAAFSTHTLTTLLTTTGNKILLDGFQAIPQSWREVAAVRNVSDFKAVTAFRLTTSLEYEEVGPAGEIHHGTAGQESYDVQAKTYARMLTLTRQDIINDDLGAFDDLRNRLGMGAAIKMNKVFWTAWLAAVNGAAFWTTARGNYQTGATTVLAEAGLNTAVKLFRDAKGPDDNLLGMEPIKLLVSSDLEATARKLYVSQEMRDMTASSKSMVANIYFNRFKPVVVPELSNSAYTGSSATQWFLLCDPAMLASAAMCFLDGVEAPTVESTDADFNTLGIQYRGYHDFGASMTEYRASVHSVGA